MTDLAPMEAELSQLIQAYKQSEISTWSRPRTAGELSGFIDSRIKALGDIDLA